MLLYERELTKQVITLNRKKYAAGLFWQPVNAGVTPYIYARQLIAKSKKKYTLLTEYKSMIGLSDGRDGVRAGMPAMAAEVVNSLSEFVSFLGVFQVDSGFYLIAVRNSVIIRDLFIQTEHDARKMYVELSNMPDWGGLFAPSSWGMPRSKERFLGELIKGGPVAKLRQISIVKTLTPSIVLVGLFLVLGLLFIYSPLLRTHKTEPVKLNQELLAEYQKQLEEKSVELDKKFEIQTKDQKYPYNSLPDVIERARLCYKAIAFVMQPVTGWNQRKADCDDEYVNVVFQRGFGTLNEFYDVGASVLPGGIVTQMSDNEVSVRVKLPKLDVHSSIDERSQEAALRDLTSLFQKINFRPNIRVVNDTVRFGVGKTETINVISVSYSSKMIPMEFMQAFNGFNGVYAKSVSWDTATKTWNYNVLIYTK